MSAERLQVEGSEIVSIHANGAFGGVMKTGKEGGDRGFPGPRGPDEGDRLPWFDGE